MKRETAKTREQRDKIGKTEWRTKGNGNKTGNTK